jgi:hypothetical protein
MTYEREQFEAWWSTFYGASPEAFVRHHTMTEQYANHDTDYAWEGWNARAAFAAPTPERADADTAGALSEEDLADVRDAARILAYEDGEKGALGMRLTSLAHRLAAANKPVDDSRERFWCELCAIHDPDDLNKREVELAWSIWQARAALNPPASQERADADTAGAKLEGGEWRAIFNSARSPDATFEQFCGWMREEIAATPASSVADAAGASEGQADARRTAEYWKAEHLAGNAEIAALRKERDELLTALADCRGACPIPDAGSDIEGHWAAAMGNPGDVPGFVADSITALRERIAGMEKDAERWRIAREFEYVTDFEVLGIDQRIDAGFAKEPK